MERQEAILTLRNYLLPLGSTQQEVAASLKELGIKGDVYRGTNNALAKYLQMQGPNWKNTWCGIMMIADTFCFGALGDLTYAGDLQMPWFEDFVEDWHHFPKLIG